MPVGPSYVELASPWRLISSGSDALAETGTGRVCGVSASSAPIVITSSDSYLRASSTIVSENARQRMFGSVPSTIRRSCDGDANTSVTGHSSRRTSPSTSCTVGRVCW